MRRGLRSLILVALLIGAGFFIWKIAFQTSAAPPRPDGRRGARGGEGGPTAVLTARAALADIPVTLDAVGTAQALNTVTVRSQVDGRLVELAFKEGQDVKNGDVLARVDPTIYQAQYDQAVAKKAQDEANLANARIDLERYVNLAKTNYGSKQQADTQRAQVAQLAAQIQADQGAIDNAKAYLDYTTIRSPLDGRTGIRLVDQGNLVRAADTTGIVTVTQLKPIFVLFNLPQQNLRAVNAASAKGPLRVVALDADNRTALDNGTLSVVDNQVDPTTGTVKLKAAFPNDRLQLWPGSFVNVRLTVDVIERAVTVPTASIQRGPTGAFVYGIADGKAKLIPVTVGRQTEAVSVIQSGLQPPEAVITTGFARLTDGERVRVADGDAPPEGSEAAAAIGTEPPAEGTASPGPERRRRRAGPGGQPPSAASGGNVAPSDPTGDATLRPGGEAVDSAARAGSDRPSGGNGERRHRRQQEGRQGDRQDTRPDTGGNAGAGAGTQ